MRTEDRWNPEWFLCGSLAADLCPTGDPRCVDLFPTMSDFWQLFQLCHISPPPPQHQRLSPSIKSSVTGSYQNRTEVALRCAICCWQLQVIRFHQYDRFRFSLAVRNQENADCWFQTAEQFSDRRSTTWWTLCKRTLNSTFRSFSAVCFHDKMMIMSSF